MLTDRSVRGESLGRRQRTEYFCGASPSAEFKGHNPMSTLAEFSLSEAPFGFRMRSRPLRVGYCGEVFEAFRVDFSFFGRHSYSVCIVLRTLVNKPTRLYIRPLHL